MRAKIGKYPHWFTTQRAEHAYLEWRHKKYAWEIDDRDHTRIDKIVLKALDGWQTVLHYTVNQVQKHKQQKVRVHVDDWDVYEAQTTFSYIILPVLERLREEKQGAPFVDKEDVPKELHDKKLTKKQKEQGEVGENHFKRWDYVLDAMIWSFREITQDKPGEEEFFTGKSDLIFTKTDVHGKEVSDDYDGVIYHRMDRGPNDTQKVDWEGLQTYEDRIDYGLRMFGKYFRALWD